MIIFVSGQESRTYLLLYEDKVLMYLKYQVLRYWSSASTTRSARRLPVHEQMLTS